ncbi:valine--tRNA ligase [Candidatus Pacearchaeota archaeon]|nr:valine--tRNA ligase [Candidatus Pacearchaeota archaeon]
MADLDLKSIEKKWAEYWEKEKIFKFNPKTGKKIYSIDTPPPTVSGEMHIGHAYSYSQEDFIARYKRMRGFEVFYPFGTDDNGLPTERLIEKLKNVKSKSMTRADFIDLCLKTLKEITPAFIQDWKNLGVSCDYGIYYSTIDKHARKISQKNFIELFKAGRIYKESFPTIYCPECQTPVAQAELEDKNLGSLFSTLKFKVDGNDLGIATTRPELLGACVCVFVNPRDKRYKNLIGKKARVPLFGHEVPIIADESADIEKGTGVLMVCSYGDKYDVDAIKRNKLQPRIIFSHNGTLNIKGYEGMKIKDARKKILKELEEKGLIIEQKQIEHAVNVHDKCGTEIEFLPVEQWFIKILDKKSELIKQGKKIKWHPEFMFKRYENWIKGLEWDWSISRDRHFGVPIPAWSCAKCRKIIIADEKELPVDPLQTKKKCPDCKSELEAEKQVFDTWMTSSLTPQIASSLAGGKIKIPYDLRPQAHDIIRTWAFYTITKSYLHENEIPWKNIFISGFVTLGGEKMSKSKGNIIRPQIVMDKYGSDALRYGAASSKLGEDLDYQEKDLITGKKFVTKIMNASRFVFMNLAYQDKMPKLCESDRLFLSELNKLVKRVTSAFEEYNYSRAKLETEKFFWEVFTDNYLEIVKGRVYNGNASEKASAFYALYHGLLTILKLMAPFTPFISEEIYQTYFRKHEGRKSIHLEDWPVEGGVRELRHDDKTWAAFLEIIAKVRQRKSEAKMAMNSQIALTLTKEQMKEMEEVISDLRNVCCAREVNEGREFKVEFF